MTRNFGLGSRDMKSAARIALGQAVQRGEASFSKAATLVSRFNRFIEYAKHSGIGRLERISPEIVIRYGLQLADQVDDGDLSPAYAQNLVSSINTVMALATKGAWLSVSPTRDCAIARRSQIRHNPPSGLDRRAFQAALEAVRERGWTHGAAIAELARELGLRSKEGALLNAVAALREAWEKGLISVTAGTKGGRPRKVPIQHARQIEALERAAAVQGSHYSLVPMEQTWAVFRAGELRKTRELLQEHGVSRLHELRAAYACERYQEITGSPAAVFGGQAAHESDLDARMKISRELGHNRIEITNSYLGGRRK